MTPVSGKISAMFEVVSICDDQESSTMSQEDGRSSEVELQGPHRIPSIIDDVMALYFRRDSAERERQEQLSALLPRSYLSNNRSIIGGWMLEVADELALAPTTIHSAMQYMDRCVAAHPRMSKSKYQLAALSSIILACKQDEMYPSPSLAEMAAYANNQYSVEQIKKMEIAILNTLEWNLTTVTPCHFLDYFIEYASSEQPLTDRQIEHNLRSMFFSSSENPTIYMRRRSDLWDREEIINRSQFLVDMSFHSKDIVDHFTPSQIAVAAIVAARTILRMDTVFPTPLSNVSGYEMQTISTLVGRFVQDFNFRQLDYNYRFGSQPLETESDAGPSGGC